MSEPLLIFPFGGNGREAVMSVFAINCIKYQWDFLGFIDDDVSTHGSQCCGASVLGGRDLFNTIVNAKILAVPGNPKTFNERKIILDDLHLSTSRYARILHPSVMVAPDVIIGQNTLLMPNVVLTCGVIIGNHCIILPNSVISHDSHISDYCCIGSNVSISGSVFIGPTCYIGSGTKIREGVSIGAGTLIGLGSNIVTDVPSGVIAAGNPGRVLKQLRPK